MCWPPIRPPPPMSAASSTSSSLPTAESGQTQQAERLVNFKFDPARDDVTGHMGLCWGHYLSFLDLIGPLYLLYGEQETVCGGLDLHHMGTRDPEIDSGFC
jgi:hypothetical protein